MSVDINQYSETSIEHFFEKDLNGIEDAKNLAILASLAINLTNAELRQQIYIDRLAKSSSGTSFTPTYLIYLYSQSLNDDRVTKVDVNKVLAAKIHQAMESGVIGQEEVVELIRWAIDHYQILNIGLPFLGVWPSIIHKAVSLYGETFQIEMRETALNAKVSILLAAREFPSREYIIEIIDALDLDQLEEFIVIRQYYIEADRQQEISYKLYDILQDTLYQQRLSPTPEGIVEAQIDTISWIDTHLTSVIDEVLLESEYLNQDSLDEEEFMEQVFNTFLKLIDDKEFIEVVKEMSSKLIQLYGVVALPDILNACRSMIKRSYSMNESTAGKSLTERLSDSVVAYAIGKFLMFGDLHDPRSFHINLMDIYAISDFTLYPPNIELQQGYRRVMLNNLLQSLSLTPRNCRLLSVGVGDFWMERQLIEDGYEVQGMELSYENYLAARKSIKDYLSRNTDRDITEEEIDYYIYQGNWDELSQWGAWQDALKDEQKTRVLMVLGRSLSHEEQRDIFAATLANFCQNMRVDDYLIFDMPDPSSGSYKEYIENLRNRLKALGAKDEELMDLPYLIDSPDEENYFNRYVPSREIINRILENIGFEIINPKDMDLQIEEEYATIEDGIISEKIPSPNVQEDGYVDKGLEDRRNMVFIVKRKAADLDVDIPQPRAIKDMSTA